MMKLRLENSGFTLLEVAIAMGVLAIGLLGLASLQAVSLKNTSSVLYRAQATNLANRIIDAMRANSSAALTGAYRVDLNTDTTCVLLTVAGSIDKQDVDAWLNTIACTLPKGMGSIAVNGNFVTVTVQWDSSRSQTQAEQVNSPDATESISVSTNL